MEDLAVSLNIAQQLRWREFPQDSSLLGWYEDELGCATLLSRYGFTQATFEFKLIAAAPIAEEIANELPAGLDITKTKHWGWSVGFSNYVTSVRRQRGYPMAYALAYVWLEMNGGGKWKI